MVTLAATAVAVVSVIMLNTSNRSIRVEILDGKSKVTSVSEVIDAFKEQNLQSGDKVKVLEELFLIALARMSCLLWQFFAK